MKRIYACLGIVAALLAVAFYSSFRVQMFAEDISGDIDHAMEANGEAILMDGNSALALGAIYAGATVAEMPSRNGVNGKGRESVSGKKPTRWKAVCPKATPEDDSRPRPGEIGK